MASIEGKKSLGIILTQEKTNITKSGCIDIDIPRDCKDLKEALTIAQNIVKKGSELGVNLYIEYSGNRGFHIWIFIERAVTHTLVKKVLESIALRANFTSQEIYPKDVNSNIKLPCTTHLKTNKRCGFISPNFDVNNPEINLEIQGDLMAKFEVTALDKLISISELKTDSYGDPHSWDKVTSQSKDKSLNESRSKDESLNESWSEDKYFNESRSKEKIKGLLDSLGDHPSCIKFLLDNGEPLGVDYNQVNLTLIRYCLTRGFDLSKALPLAELVAKNTPENHPTSKDYRGKVSNFKSAFNSCKRNSDNYKFQCSYILSGIKEGEAHKRGCIGTKCLVHKNHNPNYQSSNGIDNKNRTPNNSHTPNNYQSTYSESNSKADTANTPNNSNNSTQGISDSLDYVKVSALIFQSLLNLTSEGKEIVKSQILRECERLKKDYLSQVSVNLSDSIRLTESEVIGYLLQNPEAIIDYSDIFPQGFNCTISKFDSIAEYLDNLYSLKLPSQETIEEYLEEIREKGIKKVASKKFKEYQQNLNEDKADSSIEILSKSIEDTESLLKQSLSDKNLLPVSDKLGDWINNLFDENYVNIPTFSNDLNYLLNGGLGKGRLYVLGAPPANGKSTLTAQIGDNASIQGYKVGYASYEMSADQLFLTGLCRSGGINSSNLEAKLHLKNSAFAELVLKSIEQYNESLGENLHLIECDDSYTPNRLLAIIKKLKLDLLIVDYLQLLSSGDTNLDNNFNETLKVSKIATELKRISRKANIPIIAISDINKEAYNKAMKGGDLDMSALRDSFKIAHSADCIMLLMSYDNTETRKNDEKYPSEIKITQLGILEEKFRDKNPNIAQKIQNLAHKFRLEKDKADTYSRLIIAKNRTGKCGDILFRYSKAIHYFEPLNYITDNLNDYEQF
ncbi:replicative DNA helicase [Geminocystis sp. NIES-3709]|nr:replicative DNA helicase [Geminocystis sp. NIES-3709]